MFFISLNITTKRCNSTLNSGSDTGDRMWFYGKSSGTIVSMLFSHSRLLSLLCFGVTLLAGIGVGWLLRGKAVEVPQISILREPDGKYQLINPLIGFNPGEKEDFAEYEGFEQKLENTLLLLQREGKIDTASVYFRDLETGRWTGVNENELYSPASLYKVAVMFAVLRKSEDNQKLLDERVTFTGSRSLEKPYDPGMVIGKSYSMRELLERMMTLSDNDAKDLLRDKVGIEVVSTVFSDLRLSEPRLNETGDSMSARTYSRFFRALYNATYLNRSNSEYALNLLGKVLFKSGIINGLPPEARMLLVAHKFGYRLFTDPMSNVTEELHDFGIVYVPHTPYFVCIMTKGFKQTDLMDAIQTLSELVYAEAIRLEPISNLMPR